MVNYKFTELYNIGELKRLCESFTQLTGSALAILDLDGNVLVATGWQPICVQFHRKNRETQKRCLESDTVIAGQLSDGRNYTIFSNSLFK